MKKLDKLANETLAQSINEPSIFDNLSSGFKKKVMNLGTAITFGVLALGVSGFANQAHAMDTQSFGVVTGITGLMGMANDGKVPNNLPPECASVQGKSGWKVTAGGATGALLGSNIGQGSGTKWATALFGLAGAGMANGAEDQRIQRECQAIIARNQQQAQQMQQQYQGPQYHQAAATPTADILYQANTTNGQSFFVTVDNSPGLMAITGNKQGIIDPHSNGTIYNGVRQSLDNLNVAYQNLDRASKRYMSLVNGTEEEIFNPNPSAQSDYRNNSQVSQAVSDYDKAYNAYAAKRGIAAHILDEAAVRNYNLNEFNNASTLFQTPQSAKVTYSAVYHKPFENRFANDIKANIR